jgi:hypothetical protein
LDHGGTRAFYGERDNRAEEVITNTNAEEMTKELHVYTLACLTNANGGVGQTAVEKCCYSWLGYTEVVYTMGNRDHPYQPFKDCIWSYIEAMADGKTLEQCEAVLRKAYQDRKHLNPVFGYNLDRLLLRKKQKGMTINSHNRAAGWRYGKKLTALWAHGPTNRNAYIYVSGLGWRKLWPAHDTSLEAMMVMAAHAKDNDRPVNFYEEDGKIKQMYAW